MASEAGWLWFWQVNDGVSVEPEALVRQLESVQTPSELSTLPVVKVIAKLRKTFTSPDLDMDQRVGELDIPKQEAAFEISWSEKHFHFLFFGDAYKLMDRVVKVMTALDIPCYDADSSTMHTVKAPPRFTGTADQEAVLKGVEKLMMEAASKVQATGPERLMALKALIDGGLIDRAFDEAEQRVAEKNAKKKQKKA